MPFYMNPFDTEFRGMLAEITQTFIVKGNVNSSQLMMSFNAAPYDLSVATSLTLNYSFDFGGSWTPLVVNVSAAAGSTSAVKADEVVGALNANPTFTALFTASVDTEQRSGASYVIISSIRARTQFKVYISNTGAESKLRFNKKAGVAEIPSYFSRHTIDNVLNFPDSLGVLILLDTGVATDQAVITDAGLDYTTVQPDWQLLGGRSSIFNFQKVIVDGTDRITQIIEYPAGGGVGDLARMINYTYSGAQTKPIQITEIPYVIQAGDLIVPP